VNKVSFVYQNLDAIPSEWKISRYKYHIKIKNGFPFKSNYFDHYDGFPLIRIRDITNGEIKTFYKGDFSEEFIIKKNDLIIGMDGDFNLRWWDGPDALLNQRCCQILESNTFYLRFLYYLLPYQLQIINDITYFTTVKHLSIFDIYEETVLIPPIEEQRIISLYLDKKTKQINNLIKKIERKIELLREKKTALINQFVTKGLDSKVSMRDSGINWIGKIPRNWGTSKIKYLTSYNDEVLNEKTDPNYSFHYIEVGDVNFENGILIKEKILFKNSPSRARRVIRSKDVIISTVRTYLRSISIVPDLPNLICSTGFCVLRSKSRKLLSDYLSYFVKTTGFVEEVVKNSYGVSYPAINSIDLTQFDLLLPPLEEQRKIVERISYEENLLKKIIEKLQKKVNLLIEYRKSLISSVVTGKIRITEDMI